MFVIFCFIYIESNRKLRENEMELTQSRLNSLQLQMDPHFMANALNALSVLTDTDPKAAKRLISDLSGYLRGSFYDPDGRESLMIPFPAKLERLERYLAIERIRFPEIRVDYWLETTEFEIPAMNLHIDASYLMKPVQPEAVARELDRILSKSPESCLMWFASAISRCLPAESH